MAGAAVHGPASIRDLITRAAGFCPVTSSRKNKAKLSAETRVSTAIRNAALFLVGGIMTQLSTIQTESYKSPGTVNFV